MLIVASWLGASCAGKSANQTPVESAGQTTSQADEPFKQMSGAPPCTRAGCSGELCVSVDSDVTKSACVYKPEFDCYKSAECTLQPDGRCGWTPTDELNQCIESAAGERTTTRLE